MSMRGQRGEGKAGCLVFIALAILAGYIFAKTVPVYLDKMDFEDELKRVASEGGARNWTSDIVFERVMNLAKAKEFDTQKEQIRVVKTGGDKAGGEIRIDVKYQRTVDFSGYYTYTFKFHSRVSSFVGTL